MSHYIGIDLGGTNVKAGLVNPHGELVTHVSVPTGDGHDKKSLAPNLVITRMIEAAKQAAAKANVPLADIAAVGILSPGQPNLKKGIILSAANLPWKNVHLRAKVSQGLGIPGVLENDGNAAAYGEWWVGAGKNKNYDSFFMFTLGTGIGGGLVYRHKVVQGSFGFATEVGHWIMSPGGKKSHFQCGCGQYGCFETYSSASYTGKRATAQLEASKKIRKKSSLGNVYKSVGKVTAADVAQHAKSGDPFALSIWDESCYMIALACINVCHFIDPQMIALGGGMSAAGQFLLDCVNKHVKENWWKMTPLTVKIALAKLGNEAGMIGAAGVAKFAHDRKILPPVGK